MKKILLLLSLILAACQATPTSASVITEAVPETNAPATEKAIPSPTSTSSPVVTATPDTIRISPKDGMTQILIPAGTFVMGAMDVYRE
ncbi:MAG: hypothetical protein ACKOBL_08965, partial [Chloroflexota bacterium]